MELPEPMTWEEADAAADCYFGWGETACEQEKHQNKYSPWMSSLRGEQICGVGATLIAREQHRRDLAWFVALLRERVKAQEHDSGSDYGIDGDDLADEIEAALKEG